MKFWNKGQFGFWIVGKAYMRERDSIMGRLFEGQGMRKERERIIKLLEKLDDEEWMGINQNFIALIKGENK